MTSEITGMSHVDLLDRFEAQVDIGTPEMDVAPVRAEILRRMDSPATDRRLDIEPDPGSYQR